MVMPTSVTHVIFALESTWSPCLNCPESWKHTTPICIVPLMYQCACSLCSCKVLTPSPLVNRGFNPSPILSPQILLNCVHRLSYIPASPYIYCIPGKTFPWQNSPCDAPCQIHTLVNKRKVWFWPMQRKGGLNSGYMNIVSHAFSLVVVVYNKYLRTRYMQQLTILHMYLQK